LRIIDANPDYTQRQISEALGVSLGAVNYCLRAMIDVGFVKAKNFRSSNKKLRYAYILTPKGAAEKFFLTGAFLQRKMREFEALKVEIEALQSDVSLGNVSTLAPSAVSIQRQNINPLEK
jgi:EPS-associated MarR family transcriptional regulator